MGKKIDSQITLREIKIALFVFEHQNKCSEYDIAEYFFMSTSTIRRAVGILRELGIIAYSRRKHYKIELTSKQANQLRDIEITLEQIPQRISEIIEQECRVLTTKPQGRKS